jgi:hypothetical protein
MRALDAIHASFAGETVTVLVEPALFALAVALVFYSAGFVHELGHFLAGRWAGLRVTSFGLGVARPFWVWSWGETRVYLARSRPFQGITFYFVESMAPSRGQLLVFLAGGITAQLVLALLALPLALLLPWGTNICWLVVALNGVTALGNLLPFNFTVGNFVLQSDGGQMLAVCRTGDLPSSAPRAVQLVSGLRQLWLAIGDVLGLYVQLMSAASYWLQLGSIEQAERLCAEAEALKLSPTPGAHALGLTVRGQIEAHAGRWAGAEAAFAEAEQLFASVDHEVGLFLVACGRADLLGCQGDSAGAVARWRALAGEPRLGKFPGLRATRLEAEAALPEADLGAVEAEHELHGRTNTPEEDLELYHAVAAQAAARGDRARASRAFRKALAAAQRLDDSFLSGEDREHFVRAQEGLLAEARAYFEKTGQPEEVEALRKLLQPRKEREIDGARRSCRWHWIGCGLAVVPLVVGLWAMMLASEEKDMTREMELILTWAVSSYWSSLALVNAGVIGALAHFRPRWRGWGGWVTVALALLAWLTWGVGLAVMAW